MTREEWYFDYRKKRTSLEKTDFNVGSLAEVFKEFYGFNYTPEQEAFMTLTYRYKDKLLDKESNLRKIESWKPEAKKRAEEMFKSLIYNSNPFFKLIKKDSANFGGHYCPVPISPRGLNDN